MAAAKKEQNVLIGRRIKNALEMNYLTQEKLAEMIGVSVQYTSDLERGKVGASIATIIKICGALHVSSDYLLFGQEISAEASSIVALTSNLTERQFQIVRSSIMLCLQAFGHREEE